MIDVKEHVYADDPAVGHPDVRTRLRNASYFFLGNGLIQAAVQWAPSGEGTPVGLLIMDPDVLGPKRRALTMDADSGLEKTMVRLQVGERWLVPEAGTVRAGWDETSPLPRVHLFWEAKPLSVEEQFYCPALGRPSLVREITISSQETTDLPVVFQTGVGIQTALREVSIPAGASVHLALEYILDRRRRSLGLRFLDAAEPTPEALNHWENLASVSTGSTLFDHFFCASKFQLSAAASARGRIDGGIWQYNREWVRDQSAVAAALSMLGEWGLARTILDRLLTEFVTDEGGTVDSSERRGPDEIELDQNGFLLLALETYAHWSGDRDLISSHWPKIEAAVEFPVRPEFRHQRLGLLINNREFWERHSAHGITPGAELAHQLFACEALSIGISLGRMIGRDEKEARWTEEAALLRSAFLEDERYRLVEKGLLIKRRNRDGSVADLIQPLPGSGLPAGSPLAAKGKHYLNPDTSVVLPIVLGFVPGNSSLARKTLKSIEKLWNQGWSGGGYGRYHLSSEPDSPGAWPFPSLFVARAYVEAAEPDHAAKILRWLASVPGAVAGTWFEYYGERQSPPFPQVGIMPWTWAEIVVLFVRHVLGLRPGWDRIHIRPRLLPGMDHVQANLPLRGHRLSFVVERDRQAKAPRFEWTGTLVSQERDSILLALPDAEDVSVRAVVP